MFFFFKKTCHWAFSGASGVTPVDGSPGKAFSDCYPVVLDGAVVGWVETELAPVVVESLRRFKVWQMYNM